MTHVLDTLFTGHSLLGPFSRPCIRLSVLTANRQTTSVPNPAITLNTLQAGDILLRLTAELPFDHEPGVQMGVQTLNIIVGQFTSATLRVEAEAPTDPDRRRLTHPVQLLQRDVRRLVIRNVDTEYARHTRLLGTVTGPPP